MKNKLKGVTLIEAMLYIGLFSIIIMIVLNFMFSTQEATLRTNRRSQLNTASEFVNQHINYSFSNALRINEENCAFGNNQGILELQLQEGNRQYTMSNGRLYYDSIPITPTNVVVSSFSLTPVHDRNSVLIGVRTEVLLLSKGDTSLTDTLNILSILR